MSVAQSKHFHTICQTYPDLSQAKTSLIMGAQKTSGETL